MKKMKNPTKGVDGIAVDIVHLTGPDDPIIDQVQRIVKLRDTNAIDSLKSQCKDILDARAGFCAMQASAYTIIKRIAPTDPDGALPLIFSRLQSSDKISVVELREELKFLNAYFSKPRKPEAVQDLVDSLIPVMLTIADPDPDRNTRLWSPWEDVLHILATVAHPEHGDPPGLTLFRRGAISGIMATLRKEKNLQASTQFNADAKIIEQWVMSAPKRVSNPHDLRL